ncbi:DUF6287 domain-containing protein [Streptococcus catagoni]|uniref:DUF6287 domain-containing protein n=1 Tax=Streptococcus catagoni TaxID=2654874 RepID=UPI001409130B|nr:DUF6287 domain-containing protein [Streptococcus catagoni]
MKKKVTLTLLLLLALSSLIFFINSYNHHHQNSEKSEFLKQSSSDKESQKKTKADDKVVASKRKSRAKESSIQPSQDLSQNANSKNQDQAQKEAGASAATEKAGANKESTNESASPQLTALYQSDFSSLAGKWKNDLGETMDITANGNIKYTSKEGSVSELGLYQTDNPAKSFFYASISAPVKEEGKAYSAAAFIYIPAGNLYEINNSVSQQDRLMVGQSAEMENHPFLRAQ